MLERALSKTFANLSTLMLVALVVTGPLHLVQAYVFKDALAVAELAPEIRAFPEGRQVRGVAKQDLENEKTTLLIVLGIEILLLPLVLAAAKRVVEVSDRDGIPTVVDAWTHLTAPPRGGYLSGPGLVALVLGLVSAWLTWMIGTRLADMASADLAWALIGVTRATSVALLVAITCGTAVSVVEEAPRRI
jgi:hypothetical protein